MTMKDNINPEKKTSVTKEFDIVAIALVLLKEKKILLLFSFFAAIIGVVVALSTPKSYTSSVVLAPEMSSGGLGMSESLGSLASSFGIDLGNKSSMDAIYPELYPQIFSSTDFILKVLPVKVRLKDNSTKPYIEHLTKDLKMPFWDYPKAWILKLLKNRKKNNVEGKPDPFRISEDEDEICKFIRSAVRCEVDKKTSVITVSVTDQDPMVAAVLADTLQLRLQEYITDYRTKKARNDFDYYKKLYEESKINYRKAQRSYVSFVDANQNTVLQSYKSKEDELENELQLHYNVYNQIASQMQNAKAKIQERTPAFTIIEKAMMPHKASSTPRLIVVVLFSILGFCAGIVWIVFVREKMK